MLELYVTQYLKLRYVLGGRVFASGRATRQKLNTECHIWVVIRGRAIKKLSFVSNAGDFGRTVIFRLLVLQFSGWNKFKKRTPCRSRGLSPARSQYRIHRGRTVYAVSNVNPSNATNALAARFENQIVFVFLPHRTDE